MVELRRLAAATIGSMAVLAQGAMALTTDPAGSSAAIVLYQPSLAVTQLLATSGLFPPGDNGGQSNFYMGQVRSFAGNYEAFGAPTASGQLRSIAGNEALFSLLGTQFGRNGPNSFKLPNLDGRTIIGANLGQFNVGLRTDSAAAVLTEANLPAHRHRLTATAETDIAGEGAAFDKRQPGLNLLQMVAVKGDYPLQNATTGVTFVGQIGSFAGNFAPDGWLPADGRLLSIAQYEPLFQVIGTTYGGDGQQTFALPNLVGRAAVGAGTGVGLAPVSLGASFGSDTVVLTEAMMPIHAHSFEGGITGPAGGGSAPFDNYQASLGINYLIALRGLFPLRDDSGELPAAGPAMLGEIVGFAGTFAPEGWAFANGQRLPIAQNQALFSLLGTNFGGNGQTDFALPDLRGRSMIGTGRGFDVGSRLGSSKTLLTEEQLAFHVHGPVFNVPIPEPSSWAMLIAGFGVVGAAVRRRRAQTA